MSTQECELEMEQVRRALVITNSELADCMAELPNTLAMEIQLAWDGISLVLAVWGLARFCWDIRHRHPLMFPLDR